MKTVVYLANLQMKVVLGTATNNGINVKQAYTFDTPEGSIINGMVMDVDAFSSFLNSVWESNNFSKKDITLVINSNKFIGRTIELPVLSDRQTVDFIAREYGDMGKEEDYYFSYVNVANAEGKRKKIYAEGITPDFIKDYIDLFNLAGIKLTEIYSGESGLISFTGYTLAKESRSFVMLLADEMTFTTILWLDGAFYYYNSARCFHEQGTAEYASDIARSLSQLMQFMKAHQIETPLENIYLAGVSKEDEGLYRNAIMEMGIDVPACVYDFRFGNTTYDADMYKFIHAVSGLCVKEKNLNFLVQHAKFGRKKKAEKNTALISNIILLGSIFVVMILILLVLSIVAAGKGKRYRELEEYNNSPTRQAELTDYEYYMRRNTYLMSQYEAIEDIDNNIVTYPTGNSVVLGTFDECAYGYAEVEYDSFDAVSGVISITAKAKNVEDINKFIKNLTQKDIFDSVDYTGYRYNEVQDIWDVNVTCILAEAAGR